MSLRNQEICRWVLACLFLVLSALYGGEPYRPAIEPSQFTNVVTNPYFPLVPGTISTFMEIEGREKRENIVTVTQETKTILGVKCVVVHETVTLNGILKEDTFDWFAQDSRGAVWYFGESTREFRSGGRVSTAGSWEAGVNHAQPGIMMPAHPHVGERYRMEYAANEAEDIGRIESLGENIAVPYGSFTECVRTREWSMLESGSTRKWYAKGIGLVRAESTAGDISRLVSVTQK